MLKCTATVVLTVAFAAPICCAETFGFGRAPTVEEVQAWDIAIGPGGQELPIGSGSVAAGATVYAQFCAACHGAKGNDGADAKLTGGHGTLDSAKPVQTIGSYWPYATTIFDYVRRAMPFTAPGSLSNNDVYAVTAFLLEQNEIVAADFIADRSTLPAVDMPNRNGFFPDPRPETFKHAFEAAEGEK